MGRSHQASAESSLNCVDSSTENRDTATGRVIEVASSVATLTTAGPPALWTQVSTGVSYRA